MTSENADYSQNIANYGAAAVKKYRDISGIRNDNEIPEIFLGGQKLRLLPRRTCKFCLKHRLR